MERLQRVIAARGISSRRSAEELITSGRVLVNGAPVTELGTRVDATADEIQVDGRVLRPQRLRTILLNKPGGYITTMQDERERRTVMDLIETRERLFPVGRLDRDTEGLLLLTNDGELANRIMHPRYKLAKEYHVLTNARPTDRTLQYLRDGVRIDARDVVPDEIRLLRETREGIWIRIVIHEGFYHAVRRIMEAANINVLRLRRHRIGPISLTGVDVGLYRDLTPGELSQISEAVHLDRDAEQTASPSVERSDVSDPPRTTGRATPRQGRARLTSERGLADGFRSSERRDGGGRGPERTVDRPAARGRQHQSPTSQPPRSPIVERPGAWSARRPENAVPPRGPRLVGAARGGSGDTGAAVPPSAPATPAVQAPASTPDVSGRFETVGGRRFSEVNRSYQSERPAAERRPAPRPEPRRPRRDQPGGDDRSRSDRPWTDGARPMSGTAPSDNEGGRQGGRPPGDTRPAAHWDDLRRPSGPGRASEGFGPRRPFPDRSGRPEQRRGGDRPEGDRRPESSTQLAIEPRSDRRDAQPVRRQPARRPTSPGQAGMADPGSRRPFPGRGSRPLTVRPSAEPAGGVRRPGQQRDGNAAERPPVADRGGRPAQRRPGRRPDGAGPAGRSLETVGRSSRKVESDDPDGAPSRLKRRSPHSHSHRGRKPKPVAARINTTKARSTKTTQGKGGKRGRRR